MPELVTDWVTLEVTRVLEEVLVGPAPGESVAVSVSVLVRESVSAGVWVAAADAELVEVALPKHGMYEGVVWRIAVPLYCGQPGTSVLGGARPPPQSKGSQI